MATEDRESLPDFDEIRVPEQDLAEITTASMAQNVASFRSLLTRYEAALTDPNVDLRRVVFILGESLAAAREIVQGFEREKQAGKPPSMPQLEVIKLQQFASKVPRRALLTIAKRYPYVSGPFVNELMDWAKSLPESADRDRYTAEAFGASKVFDQMLIDTNSIQMLVPIYLNKAATATDAFERLLAAFGGMAPPGMPPPNEPSSSSRGGGDGIERRVERLEVAMTQVAESFADMRATLAAMGESMKHMATKEDLARMAKPDMPSGGLATKEDLTPLATDISWIKERLKHVPTKFGLVVAAAVPVASGLWWIFQQLFSAAMQ